MGKILFFVLFSISSSFASAAGHCNAVGRVGGESEVCAQYTEKESCESRTHWAWCGWQEERQNAPTTTTEAPAYGHEPLHVVCLDQSGAVIGTYDVGFVAFSTQPGARAIATSFGKNRQDDGFLYLNGNCQITATRN